MSAGLATLVPDRASTALATEHMVKDSSTRAKTSRALRRMLSA